MLFVTQQNSENLVYTHDDLPSILNPLFNPN